MRRLAALLYDVFLVGAIWMVLGFVLQLAFGTGTSTLVDGKVETDPLFSNILFVVMVLSCSGFYILFWCRSGQTLGMIAWRIKVEDLQGRLITPGAGIIRFLAAWPSFFFLGLGYFWLYIDKEKDALHDKLSKSRVVLLPKTSQPFD